MPRTSGSLILWGISRTADARVFERSTHSGCRIPKRDTFVYTSKAMRVERDVQAAPMHSQVNWALLGLVIERPSYAYELARRFERTYEGVLTLSSVSHAYTALAALKDRALIEELPGTREGRQPKPHYRATPKGFEEYGQWLVGQLDEGLRRERLFVLALATFAREPQSALGILDRYERACLMEAQNTPTGSRAAGGAAPVLAARLAAEEGRLAIGAKLAWVEYARRELTALAGSRAAAP
jgi:DNA-binding PadR family transcriptional regulator